MVRFLSDAKILGVPSGKIPFNLKWFSKISQLIIYSSDLTRSFIGRGILSIAFSSKLHEEIILGRRQLKQLIIS